MTDLQLRSFLVLAEELNFTKASKKLCISQSTLSSHISSLEKNMEVPLFIRTNRNVELSPEGEIVYPAVRQAFDLITGSVIEARENHSGQRRILRAAFVNGLHPDFVAKIKVTLDNFCETYQPAKLQLYVMNEKEIIHMLEGKQLDVAFTIEGTVKIKPDLNMKKIASNKIGILYSLDKYGSSNEFSLDDLRNETIIVTSKEVAPSEEFYLREFQKRLGVEDMKTMRVNSNEARIFHIYSGHGVGFSDVFTRVLYEEKLGQYFIDDFYANYGFVCRKNTKNLYVKRLFEYMDQKEWNAGGENACGP